METRKRYRYRLRFMKFKVQGSNYSRFKMADYVEYSEYNLELCPGHPG
jgi:hypothetical protein